MHHPTTLSTTALRATRVAPLLLAAVAATLALLGGCAQVAQATNILSDDRVRSESASALGLNAADLTLTSRRTEGTNTYAQLRGKDGKEYVCTINGGNLLSAGMVNPPSCARK